MLWNALPAKPLPESVVDAGADFSFAIKILLNQDINIKKKERSPATPFLR
jgi:hypothetical protein